MIDINDMMNVAAIAFSITGIYFLYLYAVGIISNIKFYLSDVKIIGLIITPGEIKRVFTLHGGWFIFVFDIKRYWFRDYVNHQWSKIT